MYVQKNWKKLHLYVNIAKENLRENKQDPQSGVCKSY